MDKRDVSTTRTRAEVENAHARLYPITALQTEMDRVFNDFFRDFDRPRFGLRHWGDSALAPRIDISETDTEIEVEAELPGLDEKDIEVALSDNTLTIKGERKETKEKKEKDYIRTERSYGRIERVIPLPAEVTDGKVTADFAKGVLTVHLPKAPSARTKAKKIKVSAKK